MSRSYAFILCDNGLGHTRRGVAVAQALSQLEPDARIVLLAHPARVERFGKLPFELIPFETKTSAEGLRRGDHDTIYWEKRLPDLSWADVVVSDNLAEVLAVRPDSLLMGSFLWPFALDQVAPGFKDRCLQLLQKSKPFMLGTGAFTQDLCKELTSFQDVGLFATFNCSPVIKKENLLIACGKGGAVEREMNRLTERLFHLTDVPFKKVFCEPAYLPQAQRPTWLEPASFSPELYCSLKAALIRPGMGTVSDVLTSGASLFSFYESDNLEVKFNARRIAERGWGEDFGQDVERALDHVINYGRLEKSSYTRPKAEDFEGAKKAARFISEWRKL